MSKLMELVDEYGVAMRCVGAGHYRAHEYEEKTKEELRAAVQELERDAARFRHLQNIDKKEAQAFFWHFESRKQRAKAIDAAMEAAK